MKIIAILRCAASDGTNGTEWTESAIFRDDSRLGDVIEWMNTKRGRSHSPPELVLSVPSLEHEP